MADLHLQLSDEQYEALQQCAQQQRTTVAKLVEEYAAYLASGGRRVPVYDDSNPSSLDIGAMGDARGAFDWLADEPHIYTINDGELI